MTSLTKEPLYDRLIEKTDISGANINAAFYPSLTSSSKLFNCAIIDEYYYDTLLYVHFINSLYISLEQLNKNNNYDIIKFINVINALQISITNDASGNGYMCKKISYSSQLENPLPTGSYATFTFDLYSFNRYQSGAISGSDGYKSSGGSDYISAEFLEKYKPILTNTHVFDDGRKDSISGYKTNLVGNYTRASFTQAIIGELNDNSVTLNTTYNDNARKIKMLYIIYNILNQTPENIMGYLLFYKIY